MPNEQEHLALADQHIREAEERIARQEMLISAMAAAGHDTHDAETLLRTFYEVLATFQKHRRLIVAELAKQAKTSDDGGE